MKMPQGSLVGSCAVNTGSGSPNNVVVRFVAETIPSAKPKQPPIFGSAVNGDHARPGMTRRLRRFLQEPLGRRRVSLSGKPEVES
jgi:hypothetical protein